MGTWSRTWDETSPADNDNISDGALEIRNFKEDVNERLSDDHEWGNTGTTNNDGMHKKVTLLEQGTDPTYIANTGFVYTKDVGGVTELFYEDSSGFVTQLTSGGDLTVTGMLYVEDNIHLNRAASSNGLYLNVYSDYYANRGTVIFRKSHVDTLDTFVTTVDGEQLGLLTFKGVNSGATDWATGAWIHAIQDGSAGTTYVPAHLTFWTSPGGTTAPVERMRIHPGGAVSIGSEVAGGVFKIANNAGTTACFIDTYSDYTSNNPHIYLRKSHTDTIDSWVETVDGDILGSISMSGVNSAGNSQTSSRIRVFQDGAAGVSYIPSYMTFLTSSATAFSERMRIDSDGNVGIADTTISKRLSVANKVGLENDSGFGTIYLCNPFQGLSDGAVPFIRGGGGNITSSHLRFYIGVSGSAEEQMRLNESGYLGIGTTTPAAKVHAHNDSSTACVARFTNVTTGETAADGFSVGIQSDEAALLWQYENNDIILGTNNIERMRILANGNVGINEDTPAYELDVDGDANVTGDITCDGDIQGGVPVGTIVPWLPGYHYGNWNGTYTPVSITLPDWWKECDGSLLNDADSPIYNGSSRYLPRLNDARFLIGEGTGDEDIDIGDYGGSNIGDHIHEMSEHKHEVAYTEYGGTPPTAYRHFRMYDADGYEHNAFTVLLNRINVGTSLSYDVIDILGGTYTYFSKEPDNNETTTVINNSPTYEYYHTNIPKYLCVRYIQRVK